jgi:DNA-binding transcriptional LysR family regulator
VARAGTGRQGRLVPSPPGRLSLRASDPALASIAENHDDLDFLGQPPEDIDVVATPIVDNPIVVLAAPDRPLAHKKKIPMQRLAREPWLMREKGSGTRIAIERRFAEHGITLHPRLELGSSEAIKQAVLGGWEFQRCRATRWR